MLGVTSAVDDFNYLAAVSRAEVNGVVKDYTDAGWSVHKTTDGAILRCPCGRHTGNVHFSVSDVKALQNSYRPLNQAKNDGCGVANPNWPSQQGDHAKLRSERYGKWVYDADSESYSKTTGSGDDEVLHVLHHPTESNPHWSYSSLDADGNEYGSSGHRGVEDVVQEYVKNGGEKIGRARKTAPPTPPKPTAQRPKMDRQEIGAAYAAHRRERASNGLTPMDRGGFEQHLRDTGRL